MHRPNHSKPCAICRKMVSRKHMHEHRRWCARRVDDLHTRLDIAGLLVSRGTVQSPLRIEIF